MMQGLQLHGRGLCRPRQAPTHVKARRLVVVRTQASQQQEPLPAPVGVHRRQALAAAAAVLVVSCAQPSVAGECPELTTAPNGLAYCDIQEGTGDSPVVGAMIRAHYEGRLASNGAVFDSSYERGRPLQFKIGVRQVIQGWDQGILGAEGIPAMKAGGKRLLVIPPSLAYGERGAGGVIPPNATLKFVVELLPPRTR